MNKRFLRVELSFYGIYYLNSNRYMTKNTTKKYLNSNKFQRQKIINYYNLFIYQFYKLKIIDI